jgi:hypothetical protein
MIPLEDPQGLPTMIRRMSESLGSINDLAQRASGDPAAADVLALQDLEQLTSRVENLMLPYDAFDVLECIRLQNGMGDPATYRESEFDGSAISIELCALIAASRTSRAGTSPDEEGHRASPDPVIDELAELLKKIEERISNHVFFKSLVDHKVDSQLYYRAALKEVHLRMPTYPHMLEESLRELFADADLDHECRSVLGFTGIEAIAVLMAVNDLHAANWAARAQTISESTDMVNAAFELRAAGGEIDLEIRERARSLWRESWSDYADGTVTTPAELALFCGMPQAVVESIVDAFALDMPGESATVAIAKFANGESGVRLRPLIRDPSGQFAFVSSALLLPSLRETIEGHLKATTAWPIYEKRRGVFLENAAVRYLSDILPTADVTNSIEYFIPNPDSTDPELTPPEYTKLVETDSLFVVDDVAIIVEAKSGSVRDGTRAGQPLGVDRDLKKLITDANNQAQRVRDCIRNDGGLRLRDGSWLDLSFVRETYVIAVTLEDLANITALSSELEEKRVVASSEHPWITSLHDLRIISEVIERPAEFLLFLRRRTDTQVTRKFRAIEELDYFMAFLNGQLYVVPDPAVAEKELPKFGMARVADKRRYAKQVNEVFQSLTDPLDAWYFSELGWRSDEVPKPRLHAHLDLLALVDAIARAREPGWLRIGATLISGSSATQRRFVESIISIAVNTRIDGDRHSLTFPGGSRFADSFVLTFATGGRRESLPTLRTDMAEYIGAKKHQLGVSMGAVLLFNSDETPSLLSTVYDTCPLVADPMLDAKIKVFGLKTGVTGTRPASWQRKKRGRVERS